MKKKRDASFNQAPASFNPGPTATEGFVLRSSDAVGAGLKSNDSSSAQPSVVEVAGLSRLADVLPLVLARYEETIDYDLVAS